MRNDFQIALKIQNLTSFDVRVGLFGGFNQNQLWNVYSWGLSSLSFTIENKVTIQYRQGSSTAYSSVTATVSSQSISGVVAALNSLSLGEFKNSGNTVYVVSYNGRQFGELFIYGFGYYCSYNISDPTGNVEFTVEVNGVLKTRNLNGVLVSGANEVILVNGDSIDVGVTPNVFVSSTAVIKGYKANGDVDILFNFTVRLAGGQSINFNASSAYLYYTFEFSN